MPIQTLWICCCKNLIAIKWSLSKGVLNTFALDLAIFLLLAAPSKCSFFLTLLFKYSF